MKESGNQWWCLELRHRRAVTLKGLIQAKKHFSLCSWKQFASNRCRFVTRSCGGFAVTLTEHTTLSRAPPNEWTSRRRKLYLTTRNTNNRQTSMPPAWDEPTIPASERPQTHTLDRAATTTQITSLYCCPQPQNLRIKIFSLYVRA